MYVAVDGTTLALFVAAEVLTHGIFGFAWSFAVGPRITRRLVIPDVQALVDAKAVELREAIKADVQELLQGAVSDAEAAATTDKARAMQQASVEARMDNTARDATLEAMLTAAIGPIGFNVVKALMGDDLWRKAVKLGPERAKYLIAPFLKKAQENGALNTEGSIGSF